MAGLPFISVFGVSTVFIVVFSLAHGSVIPDDPMQRILHELKELEDKFHAMYATKTDVGDQTNEALITGKKYHVADSALTASASASSAHGTQCSRIGVPKPSTCSSYAWASKGDDSNKWLQVDLGRAFEIRVVATQGRGLGDVHEQWTETYKMASLHGSKYLYFMDRKQSSVKIFHGNNDRTTVAMNALVPPIRARFVRLYPLTWHGHGCIRWELYGKPAFSISQ